ncbi:MAG: glycosyltransferase family 2 protein [Candidatus Nanopelagicales bacterium]
MHLPPANAPNSDVALVVPAWNEASVLGEVIAGAVSVFPLILVIDDGSLDNTAEVARRAGAQVIRHAINLGQGAALATGLKAALSLPQVSYLVTFDADGQHQVGDAAAMVERARAGDVEVVLGTRFADGGSSEAGWAKRMLLKAAVFYTRSTTRLPLTDTHNGLRVFSRRFAGGLYLTERGMGHASEILDHLARSGETWVEVPVHVRYTEYSRAKGQSMSNAINILFDTIFRR